MFGGQQQPSPPFSTSSVSPLHLLSPTSSVSPSQPSTGVGSDPTAPLLRDLGSHVGSGPPPRLGGGKIRQKGLGDTHSPSKIPRPLRAGAVVLETGRNNSLEKRLGSYSEDLSYSGSLLCGVNYLPSLGFWVFFEFFFFFLLLGIISWQMRRRSKALSSAPSELLAAKCYGGDPALKKNNAPKKKKKKTLNKKKPCCFCSANMGFGIAREDSVSLEMFPWGSWSRNLLWAGEDVEGCSASAGF